MLMKILRHVLLGGRTKTRENTSPTRSDPRAEGDYPLDTLIEYAATRVNEKLDAQVELRLQSMVEQYSSVKTSLPHDINVFVYHVDMGEAGRLSYRDVAMDTTRYDYRAVLDAFSASVFRWHPRAVIYLVTRADSPLVALSAERIRIVPLDLAIDQPMYERVVAMCAYVQSRAFDADTLFLDSDAFLNATFTPYLEASYDIAVTVRSTPGLMPVNEGVIVARAQRPEAVRRFFRRYLATYDTLYGDPRIQEYYGDIRRWRGGQLSLNAITHAAAPYSPYRDISLDGVILRALPCDTFNYSYEYAEGMDTSKLPGKVVVHLKGGRKISLDMWLSYVAAKAQSKHDGGDRRGQGFADRVYSLDTTPPVDYEPAEELDVSRASLTEIADHFKTDKGSIKHLYTQVYDKYFGHMRGRPVRLLEIGVACGSSLKMWASYFGEKSRIVGIDIREECASLCRKYQNITIEIADATKKMMPGEYDIIIDDGSHVSEDIVKTWTNLWQNLRPGGYYVVEDMRCTHDENYKKYFTFQKKPDAFERSHILAWMDNIMRAMDYRSSDVEYIHIYRELLIMRKKG